MVDYNVKLINEVKLYGSDNDDEFLQEKYKFLKYSFERLWDADIDDLSIIEEEFESLKCDVDGYYIDIDSNICYLYIVDYDNTINENSIISKQRLDKLYSKIFNFLDFAILRKFHRIDNTTITYDLCKDISEHIKDYEIVVNCITNYIVPNYIKKDGTENHNDINICVKTYDLNDLTEKIMKKESINDEINCASKFGENINAIRVTSTKSFDVYMFYMKGSWLAQLYREDSERLLEPNVRSYLKRTAKVNKGIFETVKNNPQYFIAYNNGVSAVATGIKISDNSSIYNCGTITKIFNFQIVNGGQTTATLAECYKDKLFDELNTLRVPIKLTVLKNFHEAPELIRNISLYSNTQTAIKKSDPPSNLPYYINIKQVSNKCLSLDEKGNNYVCYFERTAGEYNTEVRRNNNSKSFLISHPKKYKFTKIDLAIAIDCWEQIPHKVCEGREKNFTYFTDMMQQQDSIIDESYYKKACALVIFHRELDKIAKKMKIGYKSNVIAYSMSLISLLTEQTLNLNEIWEYKGIPSYMVDDFMKILSKVYDVLVDAPKEHLEVRMWARKEKCWDKIRQIKFDLTKFKSSSKTKFFVCDPAMLFISSADNLKDVGLWKNIQTWSKKHDIFGENQLSMIQTCLKWRPGCRVTKKQSDYAKAIFKLAVDNGFNYKE